MCMINRATNSRFQKGVGLPVAIFIITLLAVLAVVINLLVEQNAQTFSEELSFTRAFYAAETGAGIGMNTIFPPEEFPTYGSTAECAAGPRTYNFIVDGLNACSAEVTCTAVTIGARNYATITSEGSCEDSTRTIRVRTVY